MDKLKLHSLNKVNENIKKIGTQFPNCITERLNQQGEAEYAIDFDILKQELSSVIVAGRDERYQFTWPDKKKSILLANAPIAKTLRPYREESVDFDDTENLYIEGDNLEVLKLLQETYLGKVKMIYIDPPYNTGKDFVYEDNFAQNASEYLKNSGQFDDEGNRLVKNLDTNGRFHTDWLNMIYPRLKLARDLLTDDGVIFISIDDNEVAQLRKICDEIFGTSNFVAQINWKGRSGRQDSKYYAAVHEYILCYATRINAFQAGEELKSGDIYPKYDENKKRYYKTQLLRKWGSNSRREDRPNLYYSITAPNGDEVFPFYEIELQPSIYQKIDGRWRWSTSTMQQAIEDNRVEFIQRNDGNWIPYEKIFAPRESEEKTKKYITWIEETNNGANIINSLFSSAIFDYPKTPSLLVKFLKMANIEDNDIILDFFSGSATTAHAIMQLNAEDGGNRKFIMVQLPEPTDEKSEAYKAGYKNICEIGKERIRRAGNKIAKENPQAKFDKGFRVLKCDSTNMKEVYYNPAEYNADLLDVLIDNIKADRTPEDLLFQVMLDLGVLLSSDIKQTTIAGKTVFNVADSFLMACFDTDINEEIITVIAKQKPYYFVMRDSSMANDSVATNFQQIFNTYSPKTKKKVL